MDMTFRATLYFFVIWAVLSFTGCDGDDDVSNAATLEGTVLDIENNSPIPDATVNLSSPVDLDVITSTDGRFRYTDVPPLDGYVLRVSHPDYENLTTTSFPLRPEEQRDEPIRLTPIPPVLSVSPLNLDFQDNVVNRALEITNTGRGVLNWNIIENISWIELSTASGSVEPEEISTITIIIDRSELNQGEFNTILEVTSNAGTANVGVVAFVFSELSVNPTDLDFGSTSVSESFSIRNTASGTINYSIVTDQDWLSVSPGNGSVSNETDPISVTVNRTGLALGDYSGTIFINSPDGAEQVNVLMKVI